MKGYAYNFIEALARDELRSWDNDVILAQADYLVLFEGHLVPTLASSLIVRTVVA